MSFSRQTAGKHFTLLLTLKTGVMKAANLLISIFLFLVILPEAFSQQVKPTPKAEKAFHNEQPDDPWIPGNGPREKSPAYHRESSVFYTTQVNISNDGYNILGDAANEPSLAIDPLNPDRMAIGWRQFDYIGSNFRQAGYGYSDDGGETWTFPGVIDPGVFRSDPVLEADNQGTFHYNSLTSSGGSYFCRVFRSEDGGAGWDDGVPAQGGDKQWMEIDKTGTLGEGNIYAFWTSYYSYCFPGNFTRSANGGDSYEDCVSVDGDPYWGTLAIGTEGELYIAGAGSNDGVVVVKSYNANEPGSFIAWDYYTQVDMDGYMGAGPDVNPGGLLGQASIAVNQAPGPGQGNVYVLVSVSRISNGDPGDVMFAKSTDGGLSFSDPVRINDDFSISNTQWFGTMSVAPNGRIDVVWLDTRDAPANDPVWSALYYSYSLDQGETWSDNELLSDSFDPHVGWPNQEKMGDYFDMISDNGNAHLAWAATLNGEQDVYYGRITPLITGISGPDSDGSLLTFNVSPNPLTSTSAVTFNLARGSHVKIELYSLTGALTHTLADGFFTPGVHSVKLGDLPLPAGFYTCTITAGNSKKTVKLAKVAQ